MSLAPHGVLLLDKPLGLSSNAALQRVRHLAGRIKAGHTGSLDPLATGMLPICLGEATKLAGEMLSQSKAYCFGVQLGERSATGDAEGQVIERLNVPELDDAAINAVLARFLGEQQQVPPMYSALKRDGQPLYRLARAGIEVERPARTVHIRSLQLLQRQATQLLLRVVCSKGTYVRVLGEDLARALGTCGRLYSLRREYVEPFEGHPMITLDALQACAQAQQAWPILPMDAAVPHLPALPLAPADARSLRFGQTVSGVAAGVALWRLYDAGQFIGLGDSDAAGVLRVRRLLADLARP